MVYNIQENVDLRHWGKQVLESVNMTENKKGRLVWYTYPSYQISPESGLRFDTDLYEFMNDLILEESVTCHYDFDLNGLPTDVMQISPILSLIKT
jgi:hypothetical protein